MMVELATLLWVRVRPARVVWGLVGGSGLLWMGASDKHKTSEVQNWVGSHAMEAGSGLWLRDTKCLNGKGVYVNG